MRMSSRSLLSFVWLLSLGCGAEHAETSAARNDALRKLEGDVGQSPENGPGKRADGSSEEAEGGAEGETSPGALDCTNGDAVDDVRVIFDCDQVHIESCKDLSNVVLELDDGERQRFEGLTGHASSFTGTGEWDGAAILKVWVKAGANHSGEGPGYGQRFDAPADSCETDAEDSGTDAPSPADEGEDDGEVDGEDVIVV